MYELGWLVIHAPANWKEGLDNGMASGKGIS